MEAFNFDNKSTMALLNIIYEHKQSILQTSYMKNSKNIKAAAWETVRSQMEVLGYRTTVKKLFDYWVSRNVILIVISILYIHSCFIYSFSFTFTAS